ncbi:MAG TPA: Gfo/Idh/MocA family oxidoreductase [Ktedonobacteraceae bacterium]|nr:Gfo/Idh/MocA family oxidoreductase [Ktedonobacteraceae bacterium]
MTIRIIQVGLGGWGQNWAANVVSHYKGVEPVAWVEIDAETLQRAQQRLNLPEERCFTSFEAALETVETDAVLITASLGGHVPSALMALQADKHVLMEKPFAPSLQEALQVVELARQRGRVLMISQNYRYYPAPRVAAELVRDNELGPVGVVNLDFRKYSNKAPVENHRHYHIWHPLLVDMAIHHFDLMRMILGQEPRQITCQTYNPPWSKFVEPPAATATILFDGGTVVSYRGSWVSPGTPTNWAGEWNMECERGEIVWTSRGEQPEKVLLRPLDKRTRSVELPTLEYTDRSGSLDAFVRAIETGEEPETSGRDNLKTIALMFAAVASANAGQPVDIPSPEGLS